jgi:hypothetical protein
MKTNSKIVKELINKHILECVTDENGQRYTLLQDAKNRLNNEFKRVANYPYNLQKFPNNQDRFSDYLLGLPFDFEYSYFGINEFLNSLGINPNNKTYSDDKKLKLYHYLIFKELCKNQ